MLIKIHKDPEGVRNYSIENSVNYNYSGTGLFKFLMSLLLALEIPCYGKEDAIWVAGTCLITVTTIQAIVDMPKSSSIKFELFRIIQRAKELYDSVEFSVTKDMTNFN